MKKALSLCIALLTYASVVSQTVKDNLDKQSKDPAKKERSARADVLIQPQIIMDTTAIVKKEHPFASVRKKKKNCKFRTCN